MLKSVINILLDLETVLKSLPSDSQFAEDRAAFLEARDRLTKLRILLENEEHDAFQKYAKPAADGKCGCTRCKTAAAIEVIEGLSYEELVAIVTSELQTVADESVPCSAGAGSSGCAESKSPDAVL